jgi:hypothetical protein
VSLYQGFVVLGTLGYRTQYGRVEAGCAPIWHYALLVLWYLIIV